MRPNNVLMALVLMAAAPVAADHDARLDTSFEFPARTGARHTLVTFTKPPGTASATPKIAKRYLSPDGDFCFQQTTAGDWKTRTERLVDVVEAFVVPSYLECEDDPGSRTWVQSDLDRCLDDDGNFLGKIQLAAVTECAIDGAPLELSGALFSATTINLDDDAWAATAVAILGPVAGCHELNHFLNPGESYTIFGVGSGAVSASSVDEEDGACTYGAGGAETVDFTTVGGFTFEFGDLLPSCPFGSTNFCSDQPFFIYAIPSTYSGAAHDVINSVHSALPHGFAVTNPAPSIKVAIRDLCGSHPTLLSFCVGDCPGVE